jgi:hypothetical protein
MKFMIIVGEAFTPGLREQEERLRAQAARRRQS